MPTVLHRLAKWAEEDPKAPAQRYKVKGQWRTITARELMDRVYYLALFLESRGIHAGQAGAIFSYNCPEWVQVDLALLLLGARSAGLYPNSTAKDIVYILNHAEATVLAVQNREYFQRIASTDGETVLPDRIKLILAFDGDVGISPRAVSYEEAISTGKRLAGAKGARGMNQYLASVDPNAGALMIYTSGTTGKPKGALLSHDNLVYTADRVAQYWKLPMARGELFSFLPLCHIAEKLQNVGVGISQRYLVNYCTKFEQVSVELTEVQPTLLLCVPRLWEKMMEGVLKKVKASKGFKKKMAQWALATGARVAEARYSGQAPALVDLAQLKLADRLVLRKIRQALGLGRAELLASGAAALPALISRWFRSIGLEILEDFGQTESTGVICMTESGVESAGTVGKPVPGMELKIAEDGEVLTRGRHVFVGYYKDPETTAQTLVDGWLHTGDLAEKTKNGLIRIRGRKKEIMKTSGGKMVAPLPIEEKLKEAELISHVCLVGDGRKYFSALITLSEGTLEELKRHSGGTSGDGVIRSPEILARVKKEIDALNATLAGYEQIKRFTVLSREFSVVDGEMTPTLKMKRGVIEERFKHLIDQMYSWGSR